MSTDIEEYEAAIELVCRAHSDLRVVNPNSPLLTLAELTPGELKPTEAYNSKYIKPRTEDNPLTARLGGLMEFHKDLSDAIRREISEKGLIRIVRTYRV